MANQIALCQKVSLKNSHMLEEADKSQGFRPQEKNKKECAAFVTMTTAWQ